MEFLQTVADFFLHVDEHLQAVIAQYGTLTYVILIAVIFVETGLVIMPFLPGDSLLFAAGAFAAQGSLNPYLLFVFLSIAAIVGDSVNYAVGKAVGPRVFKEHYRFLNAKHLQKAELFYEKHGAKTIIFARFMPIIRTLAPFVAGVGRMNYPRFLAYNVIGGVVWVGMFVAAGYFFGTIPVVEKNFEYVILAIIFLSILPPVIEFLRGHFRKDPVATVRPSL